MLLPANVCPVVPLTLHKAGRQFEFIDISPKTLCIDHEKLLSRWTASINRPAGLIYVRTYGAIFDAATLFDELKWRSPQALIVDDRCACVPSFVVSTSSSQTDATLYSTGYAKYADVGYGGYAILSDAALYHRFRLPYDPHDLELQTIRYKKVLADGDEFNYIDNAWLDFAEPEVDWATYRKTVETQIRQVSKIKHSINKIYTNGLPPDIQLPLEFQSWRFNIHVADKLALLAAIGKAGLFASGHYESLSGLFGRGVGETARTVHQHVINLFNDFHFDEAKAAKLVDLIFSTKGLAPSPLLL